MDRYYRKQIKLRNFEMPLDEDFESEVEWLCKCLGVCDEEELPIGIFKTLIKASYKGKPVSSTMLVKGSGVTRGAIVYHLNRLIQSGLVVRKGRVYSLRDSTLTSTIDEVEEDALRLLKRMRGIAEKIDSKMR